MRTDGNRNAIIPKQEWNFGAGCGMIEKIDGRE